MLYGKALRNFERIEQTRWQQHMNNNRYSAFLSSIRLDIYANCTDSYSETLIVAIPYNKYTSILKHILSVLMRCQSCHGFVINVFASQNTDRKTRKAIISIYP